MVRLLLPRQSNLHSALGQLHAFVCAASTTTDTVIHNAEISYIIFLYYNLLKYFIFNLPPKPHNEVLFNCCVQM